MFFIVSQAYRSLGVYIKLVLTRSGKISFANRVPASKFIELLHAMGKSVGRDCVLGKELGIHVQRGP